MIGAIGGNTGWYKFACCPPPDPAVWDCAAFYTDVQDVGDGDAYFLDRHETDFMGSENKAQNFTFLSLGAGPPYRARRTPT